jgi:enediyne biosynthesis protein E4
VSDKAGRYFRERYVGRGLAVADYDGDGKPDLAFGNCGGPYKLLRNMTPTGHRGLSLDLVGDGVKSNKNAVGARVVVEVGGKRQTNWVLGGGSYLAASERRQTVGLGTAEKAERVTITWPSGRVQELKDVAAGRWRVAEGAAPVPLK